MNKTIEEKYKELVKSYTKNLPAKVKEIETAYETLANKWDGTNLFNLYSQIHKLSGSAGIYGFEEVSVKSHEIENYLAKYDYDIEPDQKSMATIKSLIADINALVKGSTETSKKKSLPLVEKKVKNDLVYLLQNKGSFTIETHWVEKLIQQCETYGYKVEKFSELNDLMQSLSKTELPVAVIIDFDYLVNSMRINFTDPAINDMLKLHFAHSYPIFVAKSGEFDKRLQAARLGCKSYFVSSFNTHDLIDELDRLKNLWTTKYKAIIVDDDQEVLNYYTNVLQAENIELTTLISIQNLEKTLHTFNPDIILLDLNMPECNGMEAATVIRQQKWFENIPIIFVSAEQDVDKQLAAMSVGADEFILKSADPSHLILAIKNKADRFKRLKSMLVKNYLTGGFDYRYMLKKIEKYLPQYKNSDKVFSICMAKVDKMQTIIKTHGYSAADQVLLSLYDLFKKELEQTITIGHYANDEFLLLFPDAGSQDVIKKMGEIQTKFRSTLQHSMNEAYACTFSIGVATLENYDTLDTFVEKAKRGLSSNLKK